MLCYNCMSCVYIYIDSFSALIRLLTCCESPSINIPTLYHLISSHRYRSLQSLCSYLVRYSRCMYACMHVSDVQMDDTTDSIVAIPSYNNHHQLSLCCDRPHHLPIRPSSTTSSSHLNTQSSHLITQVISPMSSLTHPLSLNSSISSAILSHLILSLSIHSSHHSPHLNNLILLHGDGDRYG